MCIENRVASLCVKVAIFIITLLGLVWHSGLSSGSFQPFMLGYFTTLVCLLILLYYAVDIGYHLYGVILLGRRGSTSANGMLKGGLVVAAMMTMTVYQAVLAKTSLFSDNTQTRLPGIILHMLVPVMVLLDYILFDVKGRLRLHYPFIWLALPVAYYAGVLWAANSGVRYMGGARFPYPFMDVTVMGWAGVLPALAIVGALWLLYGYLLCGLDRLLHRVWQRAVLPGKWHSKKVGEPDGI